MHAIGIEAVPASSLGVLTVALAIKLYLLVDDVVFTGHVVDIAPSFGNGGIGVVELGRSGEMRDVASVNHEGRLCRQRFDLADRLPERADRIGIGRLVGADMAVG